ncbi:MAG TPA: peptidylprolyl isomerase, partial [Chitinophagaceae bacterium]|nr:peptidylprolyl isomerase [Chitinophagaceae bacterium]
PYAIENLVYKTPAGSVAPLYVSKKGYHIFKNAGERPAFGSIKAAQILIAFPPEASAAEKATAKRRADSIYNAVLKGADFGKLATRYSNDVTSAEANGQLPTIGVGEYNAIFENAVFGLPKNGAVSKPFLTTHGYHIVKQLERLPAPTDITSEKALQVLQSKVESSDRMESMKQTLAQTILKQASFKKQNFNEPLLWAYSDSVLQGGAAPAGAPFTDSTVLFTIGDKNATVAEWIVHAQTYRYKPDGSGLKPYPQLWDEFVQATALNFYKEHLEQYNDAFRQQLDEFKDGNLFFEIMQREVWNKAQEDTVALEHFYKAHAANYTWKQSADAVIFYATDVATAKQLRAALVKKRTAWKTLVSNLSEKVAADSARFELSQIPNRTRQALLPGVITTPVVNASDSTASFALVLKVYNNTAQRSFAEAKGLVVSDYQAALERDWIAGLKKKYPVVLNEKELAKL